MKILNSICVLLALIAAPALVADVEALTIEVHGFLPGDIYGAFTLLKAL